MRITRLVILYAALASTLSACTTIGPPPRTGIATPAMQARVGDRKLQPVEPCLLGTRNCSSKDQPPPEPCLASTARCATEGMEVMEAIEQ